MQTGWGATQEPRKEREGVGAMDGCWTDAGRMFRRSEGCGSLGAHPSVRHPSAPRQLEPCLVEGRVLRLFAVVSSVSLSFAALQCVSDLTLALFPSLQPSNKTFKVKRLLGKKVKQNRPIPNWFRFKTDTDIRYDNLRFCVLFLPQITRLFESPFSFQPRLTAHLTTLFSLFCSFFNDVSFALFLAQTLFPFTFVSPPSALSRLFLPYFLPHFLLFGSISRLP